MSDAAPAAPAEPSAPADPAAPQGQPSEGWKPPATQEELNRIIESRVARERSKIPSDYDQLKSEVEQLRDAKLSADEKALKAAQKEAAEAARAAAEAEYLPKVQALQVQAIAADVIKGDQLKAFMAIANPSAFLGDDGQVDESKVMGHLTAMYGTAAPQSTGPRWQNFGQFSPPPPRGTPGQSGRAEAEKRFGKKPT